MEGSRNEADSIRGSDLDSLVHIRCQGTLSWLLDRQEFAGARKGRTVQVESYVQVPRPHYYYYQKIIVPVLKIFFWYCLLSSFSINMFNFRSLSAPGARDSGSRAILSEAALHGPRGPRVHKPYQAHCHDATHRWQVMGVSKCVEVGSGLGASLPGLFY